MIHHPSKRYIYYLASRRDRTAAELLEHLSELDLPLPPEHKDMVAFTSSVVRGLKEVIPPTPFKPRSASPPPETRRFLERWKISDAWRQTKYFQRAFEILKERRLRRYLEVTLLGPLDNDTIVRHGQAFFGPEAFNLGVLRSFLHYFWNTEEVSRPQWRKIALKWTGGAAYDYNTALLAPPSLAGVRVTLQAAGIPVEVGEVEALETLKDAFYNKSLSHLMTEYPKMGDTQAALLAFQGAVLADDRLSLVRGGTSSLLDRLNMIQAKYDSRPLDRVGSAPALIEAETIEVKDDRGSVPEKLEDGDP
jgi:hypothetical protein